MASTDELDDLVRRGAALVRECVGKSQPERLTATKELARLVVEMRRHFQDGAGRTDWAGTSHAYRDTAREMFESSGVRPDVLSPFRSTLRYHVGNLLREIAPPDELVEAGLRRTRPDEQAQARRDRQAALARAGAVLEKGARQRDVRLLRVVSQAELLLTRIADSPLDEEDLDPDLVEDLVAALDVILRAAQTLRDGLEPVRRKRRGGRSRGGPR